MKPRADLGQRLTLSQEQPPSPPMDDAEAQMRRALGLHGEGARPRPDMDRQDPGHRMGGGLFGQTPHRRRFVQDGEIPVTVVRRDPGDTPGGTPAGPTSSRLQRLEASLAAETAARDKAERALQEAQAATQALRTKIGHHELEKNEAVAAGRRDREEVVSFRQELSETKILLDETKTLLTEAESELRALRAEMLQEPRGRERAERLLREAVEAAEEAEEETVEAMPLRKATPARAEIARPPARRGRPPNVRPDPEPEQEPVKWWLSEPKAAVKRR